MVKICINSRRITASSSEKSLISKFIQKLALIAKKKQFYMMIYLKLIQKIKYRIRLKTSNINIMEKAPLFLRRAASRLSRLAKLSIMTRSFALRYFSTSHAPPKSQQEPSTPRARIPSLSGSSLKNSFILLKRPIKTPKFGMWTSISMSITRRPKNS